MPGYDLSALGLSPAQRSQDPVSRLGGRVLGMFSGPSVLDQMMALHQREQAFAATHGRPAGPGEDPEADAARVNVAGNFDMTSPLAGLGMAGIIRAYHGSPHTFDAFDLGKVGAGEGAQAYGHGLYFAERPGTAKYYHENLAPFGRGYNSFRGKRLTKGYVDQLSKDPDPAVRNFFTSRPHSTFTTSKNDLVDMVNERIDYHDSEAERWANRLKAHEANPPVASTYGPDDFRSFEAGARRQAEQHRQVLQGLNYEPPKRKGGLYTTDLDVNHEDLLDWDKPLSEQPPKVREALSGLGWDKLEQRSLDEGWTSAKKVGDQTAGDLYGQARMARAPTPGSHGDVWDRTAADVSAALHAAGIPGIRYLDRVSRGEGAGSYNVVMFDPEKIKILERNGQPLTGLGLGR